MSSVYEKINSGHLQKPNRRDRRVDDLMNHSGYEVAGDAMEKERVSYEEAKREANDESADKWKDVKVA